MVQKMKTMIYGAIMGIAFIIPGVSGGTLAVILGIYDEIIDAISHLFSKHKFVKNFLFLLFLLIGIGFSVLCFSRIIEFSLKKTPVITILLFVGLIVGGIPSLFKNIKGRVKLTDILCLFIGVTIVFIMSKMSVAENDVVLSSLDISTSIRLFVVGMLASVTMVIPGISGSFLLMMIGYYKPILALVSNLTKFSGNIWNSIELLIPFGVGVVVGIFVIAKIVNYCFTKFEKKTYYTILGFVFASIIQVFFSVFTYSFGWLELTIGIVLMVGASILIYNVFEK